jgi:predicted site-specific integrase-resolvase
MPVSRTHLSTREVARLLGISRQTLYNWLKEGKIAEPTRHPLTSYPLWKPEDVDRIRGVLTAGEQ